MPTMPLRECCKPGCHVLVTSGYCDKHKTEPQAQGSAPRRNEAFYQTRIWRTTSTLVRKFNPICQRVIDGKQCTRPSEVVHHIVDPSVNADWKLDWDVLVAVCAEHHAGGQMGAAADEVYVYTYGVYDSVYPHPGHDGGHAVWHKDYGTAYEPVRPKPGAFGIDPALGITATTSSLPQSGQVRLGGTVGPQDQNKQEQQSRQVPRQGKG
jgi:hypothetical protein